MKIKDVFELTERGTVRCKRSVTVQSKLGGRATVNPPSEINAASRLGEVTGQWIMANLDANIPEGWSVS